MAFFAVLLVWPEVFEAFQAYASHEESGAEDGRSSDKRQHERILSDEAGDPAAQHGRHDRHKPDRYLDDGRYFVGEPKRFDDL
ncbi:hypothetical protein PMKS-003545 [Pichia membranifaciens]|uniref:Uncharacterized protein n=1 Tax=Pichia membranifaciens TaxID=4926 RepID=A0A1Q2YKH4_9ASCO|nr:hypothetical protein PMKS-003545 [Pichia membranifaciens]